MIAKRLRRLRGERGYTLVELLVVLAIFTTVVTALVALFTSGAKAELDMNRRFEAQQNARLALDRMRRPSLSKWESSMKCSSDTNPEQST